MQTLKNNQPKMNRAYSPAKQGYIRYIIRRVATGQGAPISKPASITYVSSPFGNITKFAAKALAAVRTFVGGVSKVIPQAKFLRCGIFAGLVAIQDQLKRASYTDILVDATFACMAAFIPLPGDRPPT